MGAQTHYTGVLPHNFQLMFCTNLDVCDVCLYFVTRLEVKTTLGIKLTCDKSWHTQLDQHRDKINFDLIRQEYESLFSFLPFTTK